MTQTIFCDSNNTLQSISELLRKSILLSLLILSLSLKNFSNSFFFGYNFQPFEQSFIH